MADEQPVKIFTRRDLLRGAGLVGAAAVASPADLADSSEARRPPRRCRARRVRRRRAREAFETLTATEADLLEAIVARLIPSDALGPGAREARAAHYIDRALGGALAASRRRTRPASRRSIATRASRAASRSSSCRRPIRIRC